MKNKNIASNSPTSLIEKILDWLRGEEGSIRRRFWKTPKQKLDLFFSLYFRGQTYTEWYAIRMDIAGKNSTNKNVSENYMKDASVQFDYLKEKGLKPHHTLLEYGAGIIRTGHFFIPYLDKGNYTAADISSERLNKGVRILEENKIYSEKYKIVLLKSTDCLELAGASFDFIWSHDVFCHMPIEECGRCLKALKSHLNPGGAFYLTYSFSKSPRSMKVKDFWFTRDQVKKIANENGWDLEEQDDWIKNVNRVKRDASDQILVKLTIKND